MATKSRAECVNCGAERGDKGVRYHTRIPAGLAKVVFGPSRDSVYCGLVMVCDKCERQAKNVE